MPTPRDAFRHGLPSGVLHWLVTGKLPGSGEGLTLALFRFHHDWRQRRPAAVKELHGLWVRHCDEITQAAAPAVPWVCIALAQPDSLNNDDENDENNENEEE